MRLPQAYKPGTRNADLLCKFIAERLKDTDPAAIVSVDDETKAKDIEVKPAEKMPGNGSTTTLVDHDAALA